MANEIKVTAGLSLKNGFLEVGDTETGVRFNQTTARSTQFVQDIGTSEETISFGDVVPGYIELLNLEAVGGNYVSWGNVTGNLDQKLQPGGGKAVFEMSGGTLILQANTAECKVRITAFNT